MNKIDLPDKFTTFGVSKYPITIVSSILVDIGKEKIDFLKYSINPNKFSYNDLFFLGTEYRYTRPFHHRILSPIEVYESLKIPEREYVYSDDELKNIVQMIKSKDDDISYLGLNIASKINLEYIINYPAFLNAIKNYNRPYKHNLYIVGLIQYAKLN